MKVTDIKPNQGNPRLIKGEKFKKLCRSLKDFPQMMVLRPIIVDAEGVILGGNMRYQAIKHNGIIEIPDEWVKRADEMTEEQKREFIIKDNVGFGEWDWDALANEWDQQELEDWGLDVTGKNDRELDGDKYTTKIKTPIYEVKGEKPKLSDLCNTEKRDELIGEVNKSSLPAEVKDFIINAAYRHTVFNYEKIAEYYAHADKETQELFEKCALVIIDYDKAIEGGFVKLTKTLMNLSGENDNV